MRASMNEVLSFFYTCTSNVIRSASFDQMRWTLQICIGIKFGMHLATQSENQTQSKTDFTLNYFSNILQISKGNDNQS